MVAVSMCFPLTNARTYDSVRAAQLAAMADLSELKAGEDMDIAHAAPEATIVKAMTLSGRRIVPRVHRSTKAAATPRQASAPKEAIPTATAARDYLLWCFHVVVDHMMPAALLLLWVRPSPMGLGKLLLVDNDAVVLPRVRSIRLAATAIYAVVRIVLCRGQVQVGWLPLFLFRKALI